MVWLLLIPLCLFGIFFFASLGGTGWIVAGITVIVLIGAAMQS